jgi:hypothetical protein
MERLPPLRELPVVVIGAGAAGTVAAIFDAKAANANRRVLLSPHTLKKILLSWPLPEQRRFFEEEVGVLEPETGKLFSASNRARDGHYALSEADLVEVDAYERDASRYGVALLHEMGVLDLDGLLSDFSACDRAYLEHFYRAGEKRPPETFWQGGTPVLPPPSRSSLLTGRSSGGMGW